MVRKNMRIVRPTDPDFKELLESGRLVSGADIQAQWHAWNAGEIPDPDAGDQVVQPNCRPKDLSKDELKAIQQRVELNVAKGGPPSDADLMKEIDKTNATAP